VRQAKKGAEQERKYTEIERENKILLEKMSNIMQDPKPKLYNPKRFEVGSLNREKRKRDLVKITVENQAILKRLQDKQPTYSVTQWNREFRMNEEFKQNIMEYPNQPGLPLTSMGDEEGEFPQLNDRRLTQYGSVGT